MPSKLQSSLLAPASDGNGSNTPKSLEGGRLCVSPVVVLRHARNSSSDHYLEPDALLIADT